MMAISALGWLIVHFQYIEESNKNVVLILIFLLIFIMINALAIFRRRHHNTFENIHRYFGYISVVLLIVYYFQQNLQLNLNLNEILLKPHFFLLIGIVLMLVSPWLGVKKVYPKLVHVGPHVVGISIPGEPTFGTYSRITLSNGYYHPFGDSMINFNDMKNRTLYMTPAGDRTSKIIGAANENKFLLEKCTIKKNRHKGFMYHHALYDNILIVVTGGGIAPIIPCLVLNKKTRINVLWIGRSQTKEFTSKLLTKLKNKIKNQEINLHILDTTEKDLNKFKNRHYMALALEAYTHYKPEAVFVMSNQKFTIDLVSGFRENNIKAYGATFDS